MWTELNTYNEFLRDDSNTLLINTISFIVSFPIIAIFLSIFGTTPGKKLYGITLKNSNMRNLTFKEAFIREFNILIFGTAAGIVPFTIFTQFIALSRLSIDKTTSWDKKLKITISHDENWTSRKQAIIIIITILLISIFNYQNI